MPKKTLKYKTLAELKAAYESGELSREESPIELDNDVRISDDAT